MDAHFPGRVALELEAQRKPGDRNFGGVAIAVRRRTSGVKKEKGKLDESPPIAKALGARDHTEERKKDEEEKRGSAGWDMHRCRSQTSLRGRLMLELKMGGAWDASLEVDTRDCWLRAT